MPRGHYDRSARRLSHGTVKSTAQDTAVTPAPAEEVKLTAALMRAVDDIRGLFNTYVSDFVALTQSTEDLAEKFMATYRKWEGKTGGSFIAFVRLLVPSIPMDTKSYKAHKAYAAADYLRREAARIEREGKSPTERAKAIANRPVSPRTAMARVMAAFVPLIDPQALNELFSALHTRLNWSEDQVEGFKLLVDSEQPLVRVRAPRGVHVDQNLRISAAPITAVEEADEQPRTGTHG